VGGGDGGLVRYSNASTDKGRIAFRVLGGSLERSNDGGKTWLKNDDNQYEAPTASRAEFPFYRIIATDPATDPRWNKRGVMGSNKQVWMTEPAGASDWTSWPARSLWSCLDGSRQARTGRRARSPLSPTLPRMATSSGWARQTGACSEPATS